MQNILWKAAIIHTADMAQSAQLSLCQHGKHARYPCLVQDILVGDTILPGDAQESSEAMQVEGIEPASLMGVEGPCFASIEKSTQHTHYSD